MVRLFNTHAPAAFLADPDALHPIVARAGARAARGLVACAGSAALRLQAMRLLLHVGTPRAVPVMLDAFARLVSLQRLARRWFVRFPRAALGALVPLACGADARAQDLELVQKPKQAMRAARGAIRFLDRSGMGALVMEVASSARLEEPVREVLAESELRGRAAPEIPTAMRTVPPPCWLGGGALDEASFENLLTWLALIDWDAPVLLDAHEAFEPSSLDATARALFVAWIGGCAVAQTRWALHAAAELGGEATKIEMIGTLRNWRADFDTSSKEVLRAIGGVAIRNFGAPPSDRALEILAEIAVKGSSKSAERFARETIEWVDEELDEVDDLDDRIVPTLGLDASGRTRFDYGPRSFVGGVDSTMHIRVTDDSGHRTDALPAPRKSDDVEKAKEAKARFAALAKSARALTSSISKRMTEAMCSDRHWRAGAFEHIVAGHPVVGGFARGLVWAAHTPAKVVTFRVCEDRTFADVDDRAFVLPADATVSVAHPAAMDPGTWSKWSNVLADNEIIQPINQLGWPTARLTADERAATELARTHGLELVTAKLNAVGWSQGPTEDHEDPEDARLTYEKRLPGGHRAMIFYKADPKRRYALTVVVDALRIQRLEELSWDRFERLDVLDAITASELVLGLLSSR